MAGSPKKPAANPKPGASRKNRDQERLYRPGVLSFWFAVTSVILVIGWVLMFWKDHARPWKDYQSEFYDTLIEIEESQLGDLRKSLGTNERAEIAALEQAVKDARAKVDPKQIARLEDKQFKLQNDLKLADGEFKLFKGLHAVARYQFEEARQFLRKMQREAKVGPEIETMPDRSQGEVDAAAKTLAEKRREFNRLSDGYWKAKIAYENLVVDVSNLKKELAALRAPVGAAERALEAANTTIASQKKMVEGYKTKYQRNQWRNAPIVDFISPTIKIEKIVVDDIHDNWNFATSPKVDYCITCHAGTTLPDLGNPEVIEKYDLNGPRSYMRAHPHLDFMVGPSSPHPQEKLACTTCHHGVGRAIHFARSSHFPKDMETKERWIEQHDWYKAKYIDYPMFPLEYVQGQCYKCHKEGMVYSVGYEETLDHGFVVDNPKEGIVGQRVDPEGPLDETNPLLPPNRVYGPWSLPNAPAPIWGNREDVAQGTADWLREVWGEEGSELEAEMSQSGFDKLIASKVKAFGWFAQGFQDGYDNATGYGCIGCHKIDQAGDQVGYEAPPKVGPSLTNLKDKVSAAWLEKWIRYPNRYRADTLMPAFYEFALKDDQWNHVRLKGDGEGPGPVATMRVLDAHLLDPKFAALGKISTPQDIERADIEILAMRTYLMNLANARTGEPYTNLKDKTGLYDAIPQGDLEKGRELVNTLGCAACHMIPEYKQQGGYVEDSMERFDFQPPLGRGPRLTNLGSKIVNREWLAAWLKRPRHYTGYTRMPNMRIPEDDIPHIVDYLLSFKDEEFDALPRTPWKASYAGLLGEMYEEFFTKTAGGGIKRPTEIEGEVGDLSDANNRARVLYMVGAKVMSRNGCFGCHEVAGHELEQPIGAELSTHGIKDIHQLDFGRVPKYGKVEVPVMTDAGELALDDEGKVKTRWEKQRLVGHTRHEFFLNKITHPRIYDYGKQLRWTDRLRMPLFNFPSSDSPYEADISRREAVTGFIVGQVDEPIHETAKYHPDAFDKDLRDGRRVVKRYGCAQCHTIEGQMGYYYGLKVIGSTMPFIEGTPWASNAEIATLPPNLFGQGLRTQSSWLIKFLDDPEFLRPLVEAHMPKFEMNDAELQALAKYFIRLAGRDQETVITQKGSSLTELDYEGVQDVPADGLEIICKQHGTSRGKVKNAVEEAEILFQVINCNSCHLPKGSPELTNENDGGVAPSFRHSAERLRHDWVRVLLDNPTHLIHGTKMPNVYSLTSKGDRACDLLFQAFQFELRWDEEWQALYNSEDEAKRKRALTILAERQMDALTDYLLYHYENRSDEPPMRKPVETWPKNKTVLPGKGR